MRRFGLTSAIAPALLATAFALSAPAVAQAPPGDVNVLPPVPTDYTPNKTEWGDWDFTGTWPIENIPNTRILFQRPVEYGSAFWLTPEQHDKRIANAERSDSSYAGHRGTGRVDQEVEHQLAHLDAGRAGRRPAAAADARGPAALRGRPVGLGPGAALRLGERFR